MSSVVRNVGFKVFTDTVAAGGVVKGLNLGGIGDWSRKDLEELEEVAKTYGAKGLAWLKVKEDHTWQGPIAKFFMPAECSALAGPLALKPGDTAVLVADRGKVVHAALGNLRKHIAKKRNLVPKDVFRFCWVTEFPLFEYDDQTQRFSAAHHPFTAPNPDHVERMLADPGAVKAQAYDIVLNGIEIGGGSIRIHDSVLQQRMFQALGISEEDARAKFGYLLDAFQYGAPPTRFATSSLSPRLRNRRISCSTRRRGWTRHSSPSCRFGSSPTSRRSACRRIPTSSSSAAAATARGWRGISPSGVSGCCCARKEISPGARPAPRAV